MRRTSYITPIVVMGVSGCGKSTLGEAIAKQLGWQYIEGDDCHPRENLQKMAAGRPLTDEDRQPFLENVASMIVAARPNGAVASCSALKRAYRDALRQRCGPILFVHPVVEREDLLRRMAARDHFMPKSLLDSQLATLEEPQADELAIIVNGAMPIVGQLLLVEKTISEVDR